MQAALWNPPEERARWNTDEDCVFALIYQQMHSLGPNLTEHDLEDLVQTACEQALRAMPHFEARSALSTWTYKICYRTLLRHHRSLSRWLRRFVMPSEPILEEPSPEEESPLELSADRQRALRLRRLLDELPLQRRTAVVLHDLEGHSTEETAAIMDSKAATVRSHLRHGRKQLGALVCSDPILRDYISTTLPENSDAL